jgi:hypothetical protein
MSRYLKTLKNRKKGFRRTSLGHRNGMVSIAGSLDFEGDLRICLAGGCFFRRHLPDLGLLSGRQSRRRRRDEDDESSISRGQDLVFPK